MKNSFSLLESTLFSFGLPRDKALNLKNSGYILRITRFRLPAPGSDFFRRINAGCWYAGVPTTGSHRALLRTFGLSGKNNALELPGETGSKFSGFLAVDFTQNLFGRFQKLRFWWIDSGAPYAFRVVLRLKNPAKNTPA